MDVDGALMVARLVSCLGHVEGRKRLQKTVHLLGTKFPSDFQQEFILYIYGPFSKQLASQLDFVVAAGLVDENEPQNDGNSFTYVPTTEGTRILTDTTQPAPDWVHVAQRLNMHSAPFLEALSTLVFLWGRGHRNEALASEFRRVKPHLEAEYKKAMKVGKEEALIE